MLFFINVISVYLLIIRPSVNPFPHFGFSTRWVTQNLHIMDVVIIPGRLEECVADGQLLIGGRIFDVELVWAIVAFSVLELEENDKC